MRSGPAPSALGLRRQGSPQGHIPQIPDSPTPLLPHVPCHSPLDRLLHVPRQAREEVQAGQILGPVLTRQGGLHPTLGPATVWMWGTRKAMTSGCSGLRMSTTIL